MRSNKSRWIVLLLAALMVVVLSSCGEWDYEANGVKYDKGYAAGQLVDENKAREHNVVINDDGTAGVRNYSLKAPAVDGNTIDTAGNLQAVNAPSSAIAY